MTYNERPQSDAQDNTNNDAQGDFTSSEFANGVGGTPPTIPPDTGATSPAADDPHGSPRHRLRPLDLAELFALDIKPREMVLEPIIPEKGLVMLYAARGTGKTHVALGVAYAVATGSTFLKWRAPRARRVLVVDGEMPASELRERLQWINGGATPTPRTLRILPVDMIERGLGTIACPEVQAELDPWLAGVELLVLDNLSSLTAALRENDSDSWSPIQDWLLRLRRRGISVLIVHHAGKTGGQRGTSRREDVLDTSMSLRHPSDYAPEQGARFEVHIDKGRGIHGEHAKPFEAWLEVANNTAVWTMKEIEDLDRQRAEELLAAGLSLREVAEELGISKTGAHRLKRQIEEEAAVREQGVTSVVPPFQP